MDSGSGVCDFRAVSVIEGVVMKLTPAERKRHDDGMVILGILGNETSVVQKPLIPSRAANVPANVSQDILNILKRNQQHEIYGSLAMGSRTFAQREPNDIDMVVQNPRVIAAMISQKMAGKGHKTQIESDHKFNSHVVQVQKGGEWIDVADIHSISEHDQEFDVFGRSIPPTAVGGVNVQVARDQLLRKANSVMAWNAKTKTYGAKPARKAKDVGDFVTTSRLLLDSKKLQAEAEMAKVTKGRKALKSWEKHAKKVGAKKVGADPIPERQEQKFIKHALENPDLDIDTLTFRNKKTFNKPKKAEKFWY